MIIGNINQLGVERRWLHNGIYKLIKQALTMNLETLPAGRYELGNGHYMNVDEVETEPIEQRRYEAHQDYADIQIVIMGRECIGYAPLALMERMVEANPEKDVYFYEYSGQGMMIPMQRGTFAVFYPADAHRPLIAEHAPGKVKKVIIKALMDRLG